MKFITVTYRINLGESCLTKDVKVTINADHITMIKRLIVLYSEDKNFTSLKLLNGHVQCCVETPEEIMEMLK